MRENKIKIPFEKGKGLLKINRLDNLNAPNHCVEAVKRIFVKNINNKMDSFQINKWICLALPIGLLILILGAVLLKDASGVLVIFFGLFIMFVFPMYLCVQLKKLNKAIDKIVERVNYKTKGYVVATPIFKKKFKRTNTGPRSFKILSYFNVTIDESVPVPKRRKSTYQEQKKKKEEIKIVSKKKKEIKDEYEETNQEPILILSEKMIKKNDFETNAKDINIVDTNFIESAKENIKIARKETDAIDFKDLKAKKGMFEDIKNKFDEMKPKDMNLDMAKLKDFK